jgi:hypothetical protein
MSDSGAESVPPPPARPNVGETMQQIHETLKPGAGRPQGE